MTRSSKTKKTALILGLFTVTCFALALVFGMLAGKESFIDPGETQKEFRFENMGATGITAVEVDVYHTDIMLRLSEDGTFGVKANVWKREDDKEPLVYTRSGSHLSVSVPRHDRLHTIGIQTGERKNVLELFIPGNQVKTLAIRSVSGDIDTHRITLQSVSLESASGDISLKNLSATEFSATTKSGDIHLAQAALQRLRLESKSGDCRLEEVQIREGATIRTVAGDSRVSRLSSEILDIKSSSGDVHLQHMLRVGEVRVSTVAGDTRGVFKNPLKNVSVSSVSGDVDFAFSKHQQGGFLFGTSSGDRYQHPSPDICQHHRRHAEPRYAPGRPSPSPRYPAM